MSYQSLFDYMSEQHNVTLLETDMQEICRIVEQINNSTLDIDFKIGQSYNINDNIKFRYNALGCPIFIEKGSSFNERIEADIFSAKDLRDISNFMYKYPDCTKFRQEK